MLLPRARGQWRQSTSWPASFCRRGSAASASEPGGRRTDSGVAFATPVGIGKFGESFRVYSQAVQASTPATSTVSRTQTFKRQPSTHRP
jgi:hypothetical protein